MFASVRSILLSVVCVLSGFIHFVPVKVVSCHVACLALAVVVSCHVACLAVVVVVSCHVACLAAAASAALIGCRAAQGSCSIEGLKYFSTEESEDPD